MGWARQCRPGAVWPGEAWRGEARLGRQGKGGGGDRYENLHRHKRQEPVKDFLLIVALGLSASLPVVVFLSPVDWCDLPAVVVATAAALSWVAWSYVSRRPL